MTDSTRRVWPEMVAGITVWPSIHEAIPQTYGEAVALWGIEVVSCEPHEWDNRTTEENALWLLCRLHVRKLLEKVLELKEEPCQHVWVGRQMGGPPDMAESCEWVEYCKLCGAENQGSFVE